MYYFFFVKQKTAYELRISDWSSDVCSSDLAISLHVRSIAGILFGQAALRPMPCAYCSHVRTFCCGRPLRYSRPTARREMARSRRSAERRVGTERVSTCRSRWSPDHSKNKTKICKRVTLYIKLRIPTD